MSFETHIETIDGILILSLKGKVLEDKILKDVLKTVEAGLPKSKGKIILNLSNLDYVNSTGINFFIKVLTKARIHGGDVVFYGITGSVQTIVHISKMDEVFTIVESQEEALSIFKTAK